MFKKLQQKLVLAVLKSQAKGLAKMAIAQLEGMDEDVTADSITALAETAIKGYCGFSTPDFVDKIADKAVAGVLDKVRDEAVKLLQKVK